MKASIEESWVEHDDIEPEEALPEDFKYPYSKEDIKNSDR